MVGLGRSRHCRELPRISSRFTKCPAGPRTKRRSHACDVRGLLRAIGAGRTADPELGNHDLRSWRRVTRSPALVRSRCGEPEGDRSKQTPGPSRVGSSTEWSAACFDLTTWFQAASSSGGPRQVGTSRAWRDLLCGVFFRKCLTVSRRGITRNREACTDRLRDASRRARRAQIGARVFCFGASANR
jgi:hypothetical protein